MMEVATQKIIRIFSISLLALLGISGLAGGWELISDPSGKSLGWRTTMLRYSLFKNYLVPGIVLFSLIGGLSIIIAVIVIRKPKIYPLLLTGQGILLVLWIIIQVIFIGQVMLLHLFCTITGFMMIASGYFLMKEEYDNH